MSYAITVSLCISALLLFAASIYIAYMNPSAKLLQTIAPFVFIGTATIFLPFYFQLSESEQNHSFFSTMIISSTRNLPYRVDFYNGANPYMQRQEDYGLISNMLNDHPGFKIKENEDNNYICLAVLQHRILNAFLTKTHNSLRMQRDNGVEIISKREVYFPEDFVKAPKTLSYKTADAYIQSPVHKIEREMIFLPEGAEVIVSSKYLEEIKIRKSNYFEITIKSKTIHNSSANHKLADFEGFNLADPFYTKVIKTDISVKFDKVSSLSKKQDDYKKWVNSMVDLIQDELKDGNDERLNLVLQSAAT